MNDGQLSIQLATSENLPDVKACAGQAFKKYISRMTQVPAPMGADFADHVELKQLYVARYNSTFAGYVVFYPTGKCLQVENIAVLPHFSGKGIGSRLMHYAQQYAHDTGLKSIELYTNEAMTENLTWYSRLGYCETERRQQAGFNRVFFRKTL